MIEFVATIAINKPPAEVFRFVAHLENIPQWVRGAHVVTVSEGSFGDGTLFQQNHEVVRVDHFQVNHGFETESIRIHFPTRAKRNQCGAKYLHKPLIDSPKGPPPSGTRNIL